jgi:carbonic anhydrase/acetyltransferase-like protein (isoleucine patch superfamily)
MTLWALGEARPVVHPDAWVHPSAQLIGEVVVGAFASIWPGAVLRGDFGRIVVGEGTSIQDNSVVHARTSQPTIIGEDCVVGHGVYLEGVVIEDAVLVGSGAVALPGAVVRTGGVIAAGAVVRGDVEVLAGQRAQGVPAAIVPHAGSPDEVRAAALTYRRLCERYRNEMCVVSEVAG